LNGAKKENSMMYLTCRKRAYFGEKKGEIKMADNTLNLYIKYDIDIDVKDVEIITKKEFKKLKSGSQFNLAYKFENEEETKDFALSLLYELGYMVRLNK